MENFTIFCFTTFCVNLPLNPSPEMVQNTFELRNLERSIEFSNDWLKFFDDALTFINERDVNDVLDNVIDDAIHEHVDPELNAVWDAVEAARDKGRDVFRCLTIAKRIIENAMNKSYIFDIVPCIANFTHAVQKIRQNVKPIREGIESIQHYFNETVPSCYNSTDAVECFNTTLWTVKDARRRLEKRIDLLISKKEIFYPRLKNDFKTCSTAFGTTIENAASLVQRTAIRCVNTTKTLIHQFTY